LSKYSQKPLPLEGLRTVSLHARGGKVTTGLFGEPGPPGGGFRGWLDRLPKLLAADALRGVVQAMLAAREKGKPVIWGFGGHVIKCGLAPVLIDLAGRGFATAFATNGSGAIHDFEIALAGHTSEDVEAVLPDGSFGVAEETGRQINEAIAAGDREGLGIGESIGRWLDTAADARFAASSLLLDAWRRALPVTVHVALGTDTPHFHQAADPGAIGRATHTDFRLFASLVADLDGGGVYLNMGSAVILPEVFLKAVSLVRNLGRPLSGFTTVNLDFLQHYRPRVNVVERPHAGSGGRGFALTGHHEIMLPLLAAILAECDR
jgi:hypothetical protein